MARIRTIQPHFLGSTSMFRIGREARLMFILLWLVADDAGRARASPSALAALLYTRDSDAPMFLPAWLDELEREGCIERYTVDEVEYLRVVNWRRHQKIDHPTPSRLPPSPKERSQHSRKSRESSRNLREQGSESLQEQDFEGRASEFREILGKISTPADAPREITEDRVMGVIDRVLVVSEAQGLHTTMLRSAELMGRKLGLWRAKKEKAKGTAAQPRSPSLAELHGRAGTNDADP